MKELKPTQQQRGFFLSLDQEERLRKIANMQKLRQIEDLLSEEYVRLMMLFSSSHNVDIALYLELNNRITANRTHINALEFTMYGVHIDLISEEIGLNT